MVQVSYPCQHWYVSHTHASTGTCLMPMLALVRHASLQLRSHTCIYPHQANCMCDTEERRRPDWVLKNTRHLFLY